jgi:GTP-binding protein
MRFTVAILGRPNVGKSTLFNRLCGGRKALVHATPGVTRDRREGDARLGDLGFTVIDTAGLDEAGDELVVSMQEQTERALAGADVALLLIDARAGVTPVDRHFTDWLRKSPTPVVLVANKCEDGAGEAGVLDAYSLGLGEPVAVSAEHGLGMVDLFDALVAVGAPAAVVETEPGDAEQAAPTGIGADERRPLHLAIVGRPNVGKSTLLNRLVGEERVITGPEPGVTRDAISVAWSWQGREIRLIDTAGMRRRARLQEKLEKLSVSDTLRAIRFAHVVVLVLDAEAMPERQDLTIADHVVAEGRALVIAVNKWDLIEDRPAALKKLRERLKDSLPQVRGIPVVTLSALTGAGTGGLLPAVFRAFGTWNRRLATGQLNRWLAGVLEHHPPPIAKGRRIQLRYITQVKARPPSFVVFASRPDALPDSYIRYLVNGLRAAFGLDGVPIRLNARRGKNPYAKARR